MSVDRLSFVCVTAFFAVHLFTFVWVAPSACQVAEPVEKGELQPHHQHEHHHLHLILGEEKCDPQYTYVDGPRGPNNWPGLCQTGKMQSPIDIRQSETIRIDIPKFKYQPAALDIINDCNQYRILLKFPDNYWLTVGKKPYFLSEVHFREPGENAVNGKRPRMSIQLVHFSPEGVFLIIEVPVVAGKENPVIKTVWQHIPAPGKENKVTDLKINPADLLPVDRAFYRYPGSLTTPICNEVATWLVMKSPIEFSEAQIAEYSKHYHGTARPLQPLNARPVTQPQ